MAKAEEGLLLFAAPLIARVALFALTAVFILFTLVFGGAFLTELLLDAGYFKGDDCSVAGL